MVAGGCDDDRIGAPEWHHRGLFDLNISVARSRERGLHDAVRAAESESTKFRTGARGVRVQEIGQNIPAQTAGLNNRLILTR